MVLQNHCTDRYWCLGVAESMHGSVDDINRFQELTKRNAKRALVVLKRATTNRLECRYDIESDSPTTRARFQRLQSQSARLTGCRIVSYRCLRFDLVDEMAANPHSTDIPTNR